MENRNCNLWIGMGVGAVVGVLAYRFSRTPKARKLKEKVCDAYRNLTEQAEDVLDAAKKKMADTGKAVADEVADKTFDLAEKADELKSKIHATTSEVEK